MPKPKRATLRPTPGGWVGKPKPPSGPDGALAKATHEAGHAVASIVLGTGLVSVDIHRRDLVGGIVSTGFTRFTREPIPGGGAESVRPLMVQALAGGVAEYQVSRKAQPLKGSADGDRYGAMSLAVLGLCRSEGDRTPVWPEEITRHRAAIDGLLLEALDLAAGLVVAYWPAIVAVADALVERQSLTGAEVAAIVAEHVPLPEPWS